MTDEILARIITYLRSAGWKPEPCLGYLWLCYQQCPPPDQYLERFIKFRMKDYERVERTTPAKIERRGRRVLTYTDLFGDSVDSSRTSVTEFVSILIGYDRKVDNLNSDPMLVAWTETKRYRQSLSWLSRIVLYLRLVEGWTGREIDDLFGVTSTHSLVYLARKKIKNKFKSPLPRG